MSRATLAESLKLRTALRALPVDALQSICEFWGLKPPVRSTEGGDFPKGEVVDFLYPRLQAAEYFRPAFERLSQQEKDVVQFLAIHGGELGFGEVALRCFGGDSKSCRTCLDGLVFKGFLFLGSGPEEIGDEAVTLPEAHLGLLELPAQWEGYLGRLLRNLGTEQLQAVARRVLGEDEAVGRRAALVHKIRRALLDPERLEGYLATLSPVEHEIFTAMLARKGFCLYRDLLDVQSPKKFDHARAEQLNGLIQSSGVVFAVAEGHNKYMNLLMVPRDVAFIIDSDYEPDLRSLQELDALSHAAKDFHPSAVFDNSQALLRDLAIFAGRLDVQSVKRLTGGGINKLDLKKALGALGGSKPVGYASFLASFLVAGKHLIPVGEGWRAAENLPQWLTDPEQAYRDLYAWWLTTSDYSEETPDGVAPVGDRSHAESTSILELRKLVLQGVASVRRDRWIDFDAFYDSLLPQLGNVLPERNWSGSRGAAALKEVFARIIGDSLAWLGLVAIGSRQNANGSQASAPAAPPTPPVKRRRGRPSTRRAGVKSQTANFECFMVTELGRLVFSHDYDDSALVLAELPAGQAFHHGAEWIIVQPNLEVVAPPDLSLEAVYHLSRFCHVRNVDVMTTFELNRDSVRAALDSGIRGDDIVRFLGERSRVALPETVRQLVDDCSHRHGEARMGSASGYITLDDPAILEAIRSNPRLSALVKDVIADRVVILTEGADLSRVARELRQHGLMPHMENSAVHATSDDRFHLTLEPQELYDLMAAARFLAFVEQELGEEISEGRSAALAQTLKPDGNSLFMMHDYAEATIRTLQRRFQEALQKRMDEVADRYKSQVSRLVSKSLSGRGPSKYNYKGRNPAVDQVDVRAMLEFAMEHDMDVEIQYVKQNDQETRLVISPKSFEGERLYAHCPATDSDGIYSLKRILRARLL